MSALYCSMYNLQMGGLAEGTAPRIILTAPSTQMYEGCMPFKLQYFSTECLQKILEIVIDCLLLHVLSVTLLECIAKQAPWLISGGNQAVCL